MPHARTAVTVAGAGWRDRNEVATRRAERHGIDVPLTRLATTLLRLGEPGAPGERRADRAGGADG